MPSLISKIDSAFPSISVLLRLLFHTFQLATTFPIAYVGLNASALVLRRELELQAFMHEGSR